MTKAVLVFMFCSWVFIGWSAMRWVNQGEATYSEHQGGLTLRSPQEATWLATLLKDAPEPPYQWTVEVVANTPLGRFGASCIGVRNFVGGQIVVLCVDEAGQVSAVQYNSTRSFNQVQRTVKMPGLGARFLRISNTGPRVYFLASKHQNGTYWPIHSESLSKSGFLGGRADQIGVFTQSAESTYGSMEIEGGVSW